jgi:photosystem II stability/assembly factor-like uncharacterized protein
MTEETKIPEEYLYALAASPDFINDGTLFVAKSTGLYRSTNQGQSWIPAYESLGLDPSLPTTVVAISPSYADDQTVFAAVKGNVLSSTDGGDTWAYVELAEPAPLVSTLAISPRFTNNGLLLAGTLDDGIIRSTNRGATWHRWNFGLLDPHVYALNFSPDGNILAGVESGIFRSTNGGRSWYEVDFPMDLGPVISLGISGEHIFAGTEENGLHISKDGGDTWLQFASDRIKGAVIQVLLDGSEILAVLDGGIYFSGDQGKSWAARREFEGESAISGVAAPLGLSPDHPLWVGLSNGEIFKI